VTDSTKRAFRTVYQAVLAAVVVVPLLATALEGTPLAAKLAVALTVVGLVSKIVNVLEDAGLIPAWLKSNDLP
jgi:hypothetical protein